MAGSARVGYLPLAQWLDHLIEEVTRVRPVAPHPGRPDPPILRWEDDDYIYLELDAPGSPDLVADISVWAKRLFIRVGR